MPTTERGEVLEDIQLILTSSPRRNDMEVDEYIVHEVAQVATRGKGSDEDKDLGTHHEERRVPPSTVELECNDLKILIPRRPMKTASTHSHEECIQPCCHVANFSTMRTYGETGFQMDTQFEHFKISLGENSRGSRPYTRSKDAVHKFIANFELA